MIAMLSATIPVGGNPHDLSDDNNSHSNNEPYYLPWAAGPLKTWVPQAFRVDGLMALSSFFRCSGPIAVALSSSARLPFQQRSSYLVSVYHYIFPGSGSFYFTLLISSNSPHFNPLLCSLHIPAHSIYARFSSCNR